MQPYGSTINIKTQPFVNIKNKTILRTRSDMKYQRIEDLRIDHDKTQKEIAEFLGCQREVYRRYEQGLRSIPIDFLIKLSGYYNVSIDYLVGLTDVKKKL